MQPIPIHERLYSSVEKPRHISVACRNVDTFSRVAISRSRNFPTFNQFPRSRPKADFGRSFAHILSREKRRGILSGLQAS